jgi:hypothetical protein
VQPPVPIAALRWLELSARVEQGLIVLAVLVALAIVVASIQGRGRPVPAIPPIPRRRELVLFLGILLLAAALRTLFATSEHQPRWFFPESGVADAATLLVKGGLWDRWKSLLSSTQVNWPQESAVMVPVNVLAVATLGASLELPQYVGSLCGVLAVVLAWLLGRAVVSPAFGLAFAGMVAVSPLQITWARLGGLQVVAVPHTLLVLWLAHRAGSRRSIALALLAGVAAWTSVYHYYAARVAIPFSLLAMAAGMHAAGCRRRWWLMLPLCLGAGFAVAGTLVAGIPAVRSLWPRYAGYVGNRSEQSYGDLLGSVSDNLHRQLVPALRTYFWNGRAEDLNALWQRPTTGPGTALDAGIAHGGLCLLPVALLGLVGLAKLRALRAWYLWLGLALGGLALPVLSTSTARRFLIFDLAWCALAAHGAIALARMRPLVEVSPGARRAVFAGAVLALAAWSGGGLALLDAALPPAHGTRIPFGESGFGDGLTCLGCARDGRRWRSEMANGSLVVLVDSDEQRENPTAPGGLRLYGKLAALGAGRPERFIDLYSALRNVDRETTPPNVLQLYASDVKSPLAYLDTQIRTSDAETIVWEFRHPTRWELALVNRLHAAGGTAVILVEPPLGLVAERPAAASFPPLQIRMPRSRWPEARKALEQFMRLDPEPGCATLVRRGSSEQGNLALSVLGSMPEQGPPPVWIVGSYDFVTVGRNKFTVQEPVAMGLETRDGVAPVVRLLDRHGGEVRIGPAPAARMRVPALPSRIEHACAAFARNTWWVVDALNGRLSAAPTPPWPLPEGAWTGIAASGDLVYLASAEQEIQVLDTVTGRIVRRFPAVVAPGWGVRLGDCSPIAVGNGWVATLSPQAARLTIQDETGKLLVREDLTKLLALGTSGTSALAAKGDYLAVAHLNGVDVLEVKLTPGCREHGS